MGLVFRQGAVRVVGNAVGADHRVRVAQDRFDVLLRHGEMDGGHPAFFVDHQVQSGVDGRLALTLAEFGQCQPLRLAAVAGDADLQDVPVPIARLDLGDDPRAD